ncbi:MAG TPA: hypothetical protein ENI06_02705 [Spirochaetales bacterium]|nr:hypothetical protein [Spirochaetales bacterium]
MKVKQGVCRWSGILLLLVLTSCSISAPNRSFSFLIISDTHVRLPGYPDNPDYNNQLNIDNLESAVTRINLQYPHADFVLVTGDLVGCLFSDDAADYLVGQENPAEEFKSIMDGLNIPYYVALGNHDYQKGYDPDIWEGIMTDNILNIEAVWKKVLGIEPYYSFVHEGVRFIVLNSNRGAARSAVCSGRINEAFCTGSFDYLQIEWLEEEMKKTEPVLLFFHHPLFTDNKIYTWASFSSFLVEGGDAFYLSAQTYKDKIKAIFVGHGHSWVSDTLYQTIPVYETGPIGDRAGSGENIHVITVDPDDNLYQVNIGNDAASYKALEFELNP